jgi:aspartyl-tRNA(Asn)/glutamyl-tRNA(Gln) amidotransferase subunit A
MTRSAEDAAMMLNAMAGYDSMDVASVDRVTEDYVAALQQDVADFRLGAPAEFYVDLHPEVAAAMEEALAVVAELSSGVVSDRTMPPCGDFMHFLAETQCFHERSLEESGDLYQADTRQFLTRFPSPTASEYIRARERLIDLRRTVDGAFDDFDLIVLPTERILPFTLEDAVASSVRAAQSGGISPQQWVTVANTYQFNMYGLPALSLPCGFSRTGLPIGMTIAGPRFSEGRILALAAAFQRATDWHLRSPQFA